jgi:hypothetical protein
MRDQDEMDKIQEWQEHQYNPFYWVNKFSPLFPPKRTLGFWIISLLDLFLILPAFTTFCWMYFTERNSEYLPFVLILGVLSVILTLRAIRLRPDFHKGKSQTEMEELNRIQNQEKKKKLPKRRNDYR